MRASRSERPPVEPASHRLEAFLEMLAAERGAARLTIEAYRNDLGDFAGFLAVAQPDHAQGIRAEGLDQHQSRGYRC